MRRRERELARALACAQRDLVNLDRQLAGLKETISAPHEQVVLRLAPPWTVRQQCLELAVEHIASGRSQFGDREGAIAVAQQFFDFIKPTAAEEGETGPLTDAEFAAQLRELADALVRATEAYYRSCTDADRPADPELHDWRPANLRYFAQQIEEASEQKDGATKPVECR